MTPIPRVLTCTAECIAGFTHAGAHPPPQAAVLCYFKSSDAGNADPGWSTYWPQLAHRAGALGGGNDLEAGSYGLHDAWLHALKMPACVGFTYQGQPNAQGRLQCYFKSSADGNADGSWCTYLKAPGAQLAAHPHLAAAAAAAAAPALPAGVQILSKAHPEVVANSAAPPRDGLTLQQAVAWCQSIPDCAGMWYYDNGRTCPKAHWDPNPKNFSNPIPGGTFYQVKPMQQPPSVHFTHKVGAFGGGNDLESGNHALEEACVRASQLPNCAGFTYQGAKDQQGKLHCFFKSVGATHNTDANWQHYLKNQGTPVLGAAAPQHGGRGGGHRGGHHGGRGAAFAAGAAAGAAAQQQAQQQQAMAAKQQQQQQAIQQAKAQKQTAQMQAQAQRQVAQAQAQQQQAQAQQQQAQAAQAQAAQQTAQLQAQQVAMMQAQQVQQAAMLAQPCPQCQAKGGLGTFGPAPRGDMHWKRDVRAQAVPPQLDFPVQGCQCL